MKKLSLILSIIISSTVLFGVGWTIDNHYAKANKVQLVELRLDQKITQDKMDWLQNRIWKLEDRYHNKPMPPSVKEECRRLRQELKRLQQRR